VTANGAVSIAGVRIAALDRKAAAAAIVEAAREQRHLGVHLCNAYVVALAASDPAYRSVLRHGDLNLADGAPVAWFARRAGLDAAQRPSGAELVVEVLRHGEEHEVRHLFFGGTEEVAADLLRELPRHVPGRLHLAAHAPPFGDVTPELADELVARAQHSGAHVIWIGLGTPKQDHLVRLLAGRFAGPVVPVGAAFDFLAGAKRRAPGWMQRLGLEWVHRLATEPSRLWRRYLWGNVRFVWALATTGRTLPGDGDDAA
jgi:N-acetylglucosaminyldiphosphoundecaprenol N-acetyl-beta-D-mannosaminyltransferase